jgi:His/Glu/Gln/Arg/opine family amino acid ABC transporter permease subunit
MSVTGLDILLSRSSERSKVIAWRIFCLALFVVAAFALRNLEWEKVYPSSLFLLKALGRSWLLAIISIAIGCAAATPLALLRVYGPPGVRHVVIIVIEAVRSTPELMIIFWVYFTLPIVTGSLVSSWQAAIGSLSVIAAAYMAEVIRAGLHSVPQGQTEASLSSGMSRFDTFVYVVLPQALRNMTPALMAQLVGLFKTTSLVYAIGVMEFFRAVTVTNNAVFAPYPLYLVLACGYFVSCFAITQLIRRFDPKYRLTE